MAEIRRSVEAPLQCHMEVFAELFVKHPRLNTKSSAFAFLNARCQQGISAATPRCRPDKVGVTASLLRLKSTSHIGGCAVRVFSFAIFAAVGFQVRHLQCSQREGAGEAVSCFLPAFRLRLVQGVESFPPEAFASFLIWNTVRALIPSISATNSQVDSTV